MQSKLISLVLTASLLSLLLTGLLSFGVARHLLAEAGSARLATLRDARAEGVKDYVEQLSDHVMTLSETRMTIDGMKRFSQGFRQLPDLSENQQQELKAFYNNTFIPRLREKTLGEPAAATYYPDSAAERYVKYHYTVRKKDQPNKTKTPTTRTVPQEPTDAGDGSTWSSVHKEYHHRFARIAELFGYADILFVDVKTGDVVYSVAKEDDLGTNLLTGPYSDSQAAKVFREVRKSRDPLFLTFADFEEYKPSFGVPTMFVGTTVFDGDEFTGALIFQITNERIDKLMTSNRNWKKVGMGNSGETYLVGGDSTFRSSPRFFLEDPQAYLKQARQHGLSEKVVEAIRKAGTPVLTQPVKTKAATSALAGRTGTADYNDYRGVPAVASYQPIQFGPLEWGLVAKIDKSELFSGIRRLARNLLLLAAVLIPAITVLTLGMARAFVRPIRRLLDATQQISSGDYNIQIPTTADDEFGDLATAFNTMSDRLGEREESLKQQAEENDRLLRSILPSSAVSRLKQGTEAIAETHPCVSVLFAGIEGWNELAQSLPVEQSIALLNELTQALDDTTERFDLEKLQDVGSSYLSVSGLSRPRIDHEKRAVDCALAMLHQMHRFNQAHNVNLSLDIGVHAGPLTTGVLSGERLSFDIWGKTINIARGIHESPKRNVVQVTAPIVEALVGLYRFQALPSITVKGHGEMPIWEVEGAISHPGDDRPRELQEAGSR